MTRALIQWSNCISSRSCQLLCCASICSRMRASCSRSSGVNSAPKSSASKICRISTSVSSKGARFNHSIASSRDLHCHNQKPATSSLVSANGLSMTDFFPPANFTRTPRSRWSQTKAKSAFLIDGCGTAGFVVASHFEFLCGPSVESSGIPSAVSSLAIKMKPLRRGRGFRRGRQSKLK